MYITRSTNVSRGYPNNNICVTLYAYILLYIIINKQYSLLSMEKYGCKYETVKALNKKQETKRKYKEDYIGCGFMSSGRERDPLPFYLICNSSLSNEALVSSELKRNFEKKTSSCKRANEGILRKHQGSTK